MELVTYTVEERRDDGGAILRRSVKAANVDALRKAVAAASDEAAAWAEDEEIDEHEPGLVIFDGGTYSRGPAHLLPVQEPALATAAAAQRERLERQLDLPLVCPPSRD